MDVLVILAVVIGLVVVAGLLLALLGLAKVRRLRSAHRRSIAALGPAERTGQANFFGQASAGTRQVRGFGTLVLTERELVFVQLVPAREVRVPRESITSSRVARSFLGKTQARDLLVVTWDADGMGDAAAFDTADIEDWRGRLGPSVS